MKYKHLQSAVFLIVFSVVIVSLSCTFSDPLPTPTPTPSAVETYSANIDDELGFFLAAMDASRRAWIKYDDVLNVVAQGTEITDDAEARAASTALTAAKSSELRSNALRTKLDSDQPPQRCRQFHDLLVEYTDLGLTIASAMQVCIEVVSSQDMVDEAALNELQPEFEKASDIQAELATAVDDCM